MVKTSVGTVTVIVLNWDPEETVRMRQALRSSGLKDLANFVTTSDHLAVRNFLVPGQKQLLILGPNAVPNGDKFNTNVNSIEFIEEMRNCNPSLIVGTVTRKGVFQRLFDVCIPHGKEELIYEPLASTALHFVVEVEGGDQHGVGR